MKNDSYRIWPASILACLFPFAAFFGVNLAGDDVLYGRLAADMADGNPVFFHNPHPHRLGFILPLAGLYRLFGVSGWTTSVFPVICVVAAVLFSGFAAKRLFGKSAAIWAALFCGLNPIVYRYGTMALSDLPAGLLYGLFALTWTLSFCDGVHHKRLAAFCSGIACAWAIATRESIAPMAILTLGCFSIFALRCQNTNRIAWLPFFAGGFSVGSPYLAMLWWHTGTPFFAVEAAQLGYNTPGAPWLEPLEGWRFWYRLLGFSFVRSSIEGYLYALFPVIVASVFTGRVNATANRVAATTLLLIGTLSPLLVLSHFPTTFDYWNPVRLDLRFGSPVVIPACVLAAGVCVQLGRVRLPFVLCWTQCLVIVALAALLIIGIVQHNAWTIWGAIAGLAVALALVRFENLRGFLLPLTAVAVLAVTWGYYFWGEYPGLAAINREMKSEADQVWRVASPPVLTDPLTAQYLPFVCGFRPNCAVTAWESERKIDDNDRLEKNVTKVSDNAGPTKAVQIPKGYWAETLSAPLDKNHVIVWYPYRAAWSSWRFEKRFVPSWVFNEIRKGRILASFAVDEPEADQLFASGQHQLIASVKTWPKPGIYLIEAEHSP